MRRRVSTLVAVVALAGLAGLTMTGSVSAQDGDDSGANPIGSPVIIYGAGDVEAAQVTVVEVIDPFADFEESSTPAEGERFVLAMIAVANTGERRYGLTPSDFSVLDGRGRVARASVTPRTKAVLAGYPHLDTAVMTPGQSVSGAVLFRVAEDADLVRLSYVSSAGATRRYVLADLTGPARAPGSHATAGAGGDAGAATDAGGPDDGEAPIGDTGDPSATDCAWAENTVDRLNALEPAGRELQGMDDDPDPERLREIAADLAAAAAEQRDSNPPAVAEEANEQIAAALETYAGALDAIAEAIDAGDVPDTVALLAEVRAANELIEAAGEVTAPLLEECGVS